MAQTLANSMSTRSTCQRHRDQHDQRPGQRQQVQVQVNINMVNIKVNVNKVNGIYSIRSHSEDGRMTTGSIRRADGRAHGRTVINSETPIMHVISSRTDQRSDERTLGEIEDGRTKSRARTTDGR